MTPEVLAKLSKAHDAHKFDHGHALVLSGPMGRGGAARLAARGALRIRAGVVTIGCPPGALLEHATQLNAIMVQAIKDADHLTEIMSDPRITALCIGPGLGLHEEAQNFVASVLAIGCSTVLDADALTLIAEHGLLENVHDACVLTPHQGEFARLFPNLAQHLQLGGRKRDATKTAAHLAGCTVLLKGAETVVANADVDVIDTPAPWLATAGSGDVLAGFIAGLLARGFDAQSAAVTGAKLHRACARAFGPGLIAEDLPEMLPRVLGDLGVTAF